MCNFYARMNKWKTNEIRTGNSKFVGKTTQLKGNFKEFLKRDDFFVRLR